jgi:FtsP/CotA-like multicopper oxidase with cupredoxin domain
VGVDLEVAERVLQLPCFAKPLPLWTFSGDHALPVIRLRAGETLQARLHNALPRAGEHITVHWHGVRLPNGQDGVPYLTQAPIFPNKDFTYLFTPPDTGTFFFHTHCNTAEQLGRGLAGVLIVEGDETHPYDGEELLILRDWRIGEDGEFAPFTTDAGAARGGTFGSIRSTNDRTNPIVSVAASADIRLRVLNIDASRVMDIGLKGAEVAVVAVDGVAVSPFPLRTWRFGPASRLDLVMRSPGGGASAVLFDYSARDPVPLATFLGEGPAYRAGAFNPEPLRASRIPEPDLAAAERLAFSFSATPSGAAYPAVEDDLFLGDLCSPTRTFWAVNRQAWPGVDHSRIPAPLAQLQLGRSYIFELRNTTRHQHPIHIHGHTWKVLGSNKRDLPVHHADTVVLLPKERMEVAFVADNPGDWMLHCHIIEHQETGMMGYVRVA